MTWNEFKAAVDKALADNELSQDIELDYIDVEGSDLTLIDFEIRVSEIGHLSIF